MLTPTYYLLTTIAVRKQIMNIIPLLSMHVEVAKIIKWPPLIDICLRQVERKTRRKREDVQNSRVRGREFIYDIDTKERGWRE